MDFINIVNELKSEINTQLEILEEIETRLSNTIIFNEILELVRFKNLTIKHTLYKLILLKQLEFDFLYNLFRQLDN